MNWALGPKTPLEEANERLTKCNYHSKQGHLKNHCYFSSMWLCNRAYRNNNSITLEKCCRIKAPQGQRILMYLPMLYTPCLNNPWHMVGAQTCFWISEQKVDVSHPMNWYLIIKLRELLYYSTIKIDCQHYNWGFTRP